MDNQEHDQIIAATRKWVETIVIGLNLCPFAQRELINNRIRFHVSEAITPSLLLVELESELLFLADHPKIETTLIVHANVLAKFIEYNRFLHDVNERLVQLEMEGTFQVASFHPEYQFSGTNKDDVENYTNRSPYPMLHLLREEGLEKAIASYPESDGIAERNIALMNEMGTKRMRALLRKCFD